MSNIMTSTAPLAEGEVGVASGAQTGAAVPGTHEWVLRRVHLWVIAALSIVWFSGSIDFIEPYDFWWNVKSGQIMAQTGRFLGTDVLVYTPVREPYFNPQWGSQLLFYLLYDISPYFLLTLRTLIVTATIGLIIWLCFWKTRSLRLATLGGLVAFFTAWTNFGMRPQLFAFLPFVGYLFLLERKDDHPRWLPLLAPIMLIWVNVHGSFFLGIALIGIYALGTVFERITTKEGRSWLVSRAALWQLLWFAAASLATLANPYFVEIYNYFFIATNDPIARSLNIEWQAPTLYDGTGKLFFLNLLLFVISIYLGKRRMRPTEMLLVLAFGYLSLTSLRSVIWWGWVTAPIIACNFAAWAARRVPSIETASHPEAESGVSGEELVSQEIRNSKELPAFNWAIAILLAGGALLFTPMWRTANPLVPVTARVALAEETPTDLAAFLRKGEVPAPLFNYLEWGGYLEWELYPTYRMFIDGRFEARQLQVWEDYLSVSSGHATWQETLDSYQVRTLVLNKKFHDDLIPLVNEASQWRKVYEDKSGVVYTR